MYMYNSFGAMKSEMIYTTLIKEKENCSEKKSEGMRTSERATDRRNNTGSQVDSLVKAVGRRTGEGKKGVRNGAVLLNYFNYFLCCLHLCTRRTRCIAIKMLQTGSQHVLH